MSRVPMLAQLGWNRTKARNTVIVKMLAYLQKALSRFHAPGNIHPLQLAEHRGLENRRPAPALALDLRH